MNITPIVIQCKQAEDKNLRGKQIVPYRALSLFRDLKKRQGESTMAFGHSLQEIDS